MSCAKTAEPIEMSLGVLTWVCWIVLNVLGGSPDPQKEGVILCGIFWLSMQQLVSISCEVSCIRYVFYCMRIQLMSFSALTVWLGIRKSVRPVKIEWWGVGAVIWGANCLHMVMPLLSQNPISLASCQPGLVLPFWYRLTEVVLEKRPLNV